MSKIKKDLKTLINAINVVKRHAFEKQSFILAATLRDWEKEALAEIEKL